MRNAYVLLVLTWILSARFSFAHDGREEKANQDRRSIAMDSIYTTGSEQGFKKRLIASFWSKDDKPAFPFSEDLKAIHQESRAMGASNIFLVRGEDITPAIASTRAIFVTGHSADVAPDRDVFAKEIKGEKYWLVVYLGSAWSVPPKWRFKSSTVNQQTIEFTYSSVEPTVSSGDRIQYFYWVPLPALKKGTYELKLIDSDKGRPVLIRFVDVP